MTTRLDEIPLDIRHYILQPHLYYDVNLSSGEVWNKLCGDVILDKKLCREENKTIWRRRRAEFIYRNYYSTNNWLLDRWYKDYYGNYNYEQAVADVTARLARQRLDSALHTYPLFMAITWQFNVMIEKLRPEYEENFTSYFAINRSDATIKDFVRVILLADDPNWLQMVLNHLPISSYSTSLFVSCQKSCYNYLLAERTSEEAIITSELGRQNVATFLNDVNWNDFTINVAIYTDDLALFLATYRKIIGNDVNTFDRLSDGHRRDLFLVGALSIISHYQTSIVFNLRYYEETIKYFYNKNSHAVLDIFRHKQAKFPAPANLVVYVFVDVNDIYDFIDVTPITYSRFMRRFHPHKNPVNAMASIYNHFLITWPNGVPSANKLIKAANHTVVSFKEYRILDITRINKRKYRIYARYVLDRLTSPSGFYNMLLHLEWLPDYPITRTVYQKTASLTLANSSCWRGIMIQGNIDLNGTIIIFDSTNRKAVVLQPNSGVIKIRTSTGLEVIEILLPHTQEIFDFLERTLNL